MRIKIFTSDGIDYLESWVNDWLREQGNRIVVKEMQYAVTIEEYSVAILDEVA